MLDKCRRMFTEHPEEYGEDYLTHFKFTLKKSWCLFKCSAVLAFHGVFPFTFQSYVSEKVCQLNQEFEKKKQERCKCGK